MPYKIYSSKDIFLDKMRKYCAYQERCQQEVIQKMRELKIDNDWQDEIIVSLIQEKYVDEERFARAIVRGKFRINNWGRNKIRNFLFLKNINSKLIDISLTEINEYDYESRITLLMDKKREELKNLDQSTRYNKLMNYMLQKGYESDLIQKALRV